jgi:hypothetical protein
MDILETEEARQQFIAGKMSDVIIDAIIAQYELEDLDELGPDPRGTLQKGLREAATWEPDDGEKIGHVADVDTYTRIDVAGECDQALAKEMKSRFDGGECWVYYYIPDIEPICHNFRVELLMDPTGAKLVAWNLVVD